MRKFLAAVTVTASLAGVVVPAQADGVRRLWRGSPYAVGAISRNVITPYYVGYYGSHYSYYPPDPVPPPTYVRYVPLPALCWSPAWLPGPGYWAC